MTLASLSADDASLEVSQTEGTTIFWREQSSLVHQLARLLKYWCITLYVPMFNYGRSYTMELFAVLAGEMSDDNDLMQRFRDVVRSIANYQQLEKCWLRFYEQGNVDRRLKSGELTKPFLLDPINTGNNLLTTTRTS
jgi:hypothetical protein